MSQTKMEYCTFINVPSGKNIILPCSGDFYEAYFLSENVVVNKIDCLIYIKNEAYKCISERLPNKYHTYRVNCIDFSNNHVINRDIVN